VKDTGPKRNRKYGWKLRQKSRNGEGEIPVSHREKRTSEYSERGSTVKESGCLKLQPERKGEGGGKFPMSKVGDYTSLRLWWYTPPKAKYRMGDR